VEPPFLPEKPVKPNILAIILIGAVLGIGFSVGCTSLSEFMDKRVQDAGALEQILGMRVWSLIPRIVTQEDRIRQRNRRIAVTVGTVLGTILVITIFHFMVMDLYVLFAKINRYVQRVL